MGPGKPPVKGENVLIKPRTGDFPANETAGKIIFLGEGNWADGRPINWIAEIDGQCDPRRWCGKCLKYIFPREPCVEGGIHFFT
jgi:hypothetical protein